MFCTFTLVLSEIICAVPNMSVFYFLDFMLSQYVVQLLS